jgi:hypothetical protein
MSVQVFQLNFCVTMYRCSCYMSCPSCLRFQFRNLLITEGNQRVYFIEQEGKGWVFSVVSEVKNTFVFRESHPDGATNATHVKYKWKPLAFTCYLPTTVIEADLISVWKSGASADTSHLKNPVSCFCTSSSVTFRASDRETCRTKSIHTYTIVPTANSVYRPRTLTFAHMHTN